MKFVIQRVTKASVEVDKNVVGEINNGFIVLIGITHTDTKTIAEKMVEKLIKLRIFTDDNDKMNLSINDVKGELLLVSQFTLYSNCMHGNRPEFLNAAKPQQAEELYNYIIKLCKEKSLKVETGIFRASMKVNLINDGPVTIVLDSEVDIKNS